MIHEDYEHDDFEVREEVPDLLETLTLVVLLAASALFGALVALWWWHP